MASIKKSVLGKIPEQLRVLSLLWTRDLAGFLIERRFGIRLSYWTVGRHLKDEWGLTPQKPAKRALEQNPARVKYWLEHKYAAIQQQAKDIKAEVAAFGRGDAAAPARAGRIIDRLFEVFLDRPVVGGWIDHVGPAGRPLLDFMPASTLYHVFLGMAEAHRVWGRP